MVNGGLSCKTGRDFAIDEFAIEAYSNSVLHAVIQVRLQMLQFYLTFHCGVRREAKCQPKKARYRWFTGVLLMVKTKMEINNTNAKTKPKTTWKMNSEIQ